jgi:hypothetical protein
MDVLELKFATTAPSFAATDEYDRQGSVIAIDWIRHHCKMSGHAAAGASTSAPSPAVAGPVLTSSSPPRWRR